MVEKIDEQPEVCLTLFGAVEPTAVRVLNQWVQANDVGEGVITGIG